MDRRGFIQSMMYAGAAIFSLSRMSFVNLLVNPPISNKPGSQDTIPTKANGVQEIVHHGKVLLENNEKKQIVLNDFGSIAWKRIDGENSIYDIAVINDNYYFPSTTIRIPVFIVS